MLKNVDGNQQQIHKQNTDIRSTFRSKNKERFVAITKAYNLLKLKPNAAVVS